MDNLCHTLAGAALGDAGLKHRTALGMSTLLIASNLPDIDALVFATNSLPMAFRRGWTHGVLAMAVLPAMLAGVMLAWDRVVQAPPSLAKRVNASLGGPAAGRRANLGGLLLLAYVATWLHVFMDFLNTYGVRLLKPFSDRWFYGDALYIIDPIMYALLGGGLLIGRVRERFWRAEPRRAARTGLIAAGLYVSLMLASNVWARSAVRYGLQRAGQPAETRFMVTPVFGNPFRREVIVDVGARYEKGFLWFDPLPHFRPAGYGVDTHENDSAAQQTAQTPLGRAFLMWARFPFYVIDRRPDGTRVYLADYRYAGPSGREGWAWVSFVM